MRTETLADLIWKMEGKGFDWVEIRTYIDVIWLLSYHPYAVNPLYSTYFYREANKKNFEEKLKEKLKQAHIEIDFTNYKK